MVNWKRIAFWSILFFLVYTWPTEGDEKPVRLDVYPKANVCIPSSRPTIRVRYWVPRNHANRARSLSWQGDGQSGSSMNQMEGENDAAVFERFIEISCTSYAIDACVMRNIDGKPRWLCDHFELRVPSEEFP